MAARLSSSPAQSDTGRPFWEELASYYGQPDDLARLGGSANSKSEQLERKQSMPAYVAMLRGINVSGQKTIKMDHLRQLCSDLGFRNVETYVQSGNIVFQTQTENPAAV